MQPAGRPYRSLAMADDILDLIGDGAEAVGNGLQAAGEGLWLLVDVVTDKLLDASPDRKKQSDEEEEAG